MSTRAAYDALSQIGTIMTSPRGDGAVLRVNGSATLAQRNEACNQIEKLLGDHGVPVSVRGGGSNGIETTYDIYPRRS